VWVTTTAANYNADLRDVAFADNKMTAKYDLPARPERQIFFFFFLLLFIVFSFEVVGRGDFETRPPREPGRSPQRARRPRFAAGRSREPEVAAISATRFFAAGCGRRFRRRCIGPCLRWLFRGASARRAARRASSPRRRFGVRRFQARTIVQPWTSPRAARRRERCRSARTTLPAARRNLTNAH